MVKGIHCYIDKEDNKIVCLVNTGDVIMGENMSKDRYYKFDYDEVYYIFDSQVISKDELEKKIEYDGYNAFEYSMTGDEIINLLNEIEKLKKENKQLHYQIIELQDKLGMSDEVVYDG